MAESTVAGPTEVSIDFNGLRRSAQRMEGGARSATRAQRAIQGATVSSGSFGLMNTPLGTAAAAMSRRADALVAGLDEVAGTISRNTFTLHRTWLEVEEEAGAAATKLADGLAEIDGVTE